MITSINQVLENTISQLESFSDLYSKDIRFIYNTLLKELKEYYQPSSRNLIWLYKLFPNSQYINYKTCDHFLYKYDEELVETYLSNILGTGTINLIKNSSNNKELIDKLKVLLKLESLYGEFRRLEEGEKGTLILKGYYGISIIKDEELCI
jgi:hypothetical protein